MGWLKLNVDATLFHDRKKMGFGYVPRSFNGSFIATKTMVYEGVFEPKEVEAMGIQETLSRVKGSTTITFN